MNCNVFLLIFLEKNITGVHLETKQRHWYILRSISASLFQLKQFRCNFSLGLGSSLFCETGGQHFNPLKQGLGPGGPVSRRGSSNPNPTHPKQLNKLLLGILETCRLELNSAGHRPRPCLANPDIENKYIIIELLYKIVIFGTLGTYRLWYKWMWCSHLKGKTSVRGQ